MHLTVDTVALARRHEHHETIGSTNDRARELAVGGAAHGTCVTASEQTAGRGQRGRTWWSPPRAGVYVSFVLRPAIEARQAPLLTLAAAIAAHDAIAATGADVGIRWPNDILARDGRKKVAGILVEVASSGPMIVHAIAGIGINVREVARPDDIAHYATSIEAVGGATGEAAIVARLAEALEAQLGALDRPDVITDAWTERALGVGETVEWADGDDVLRGPLEGITAQGTLLIGGRAVHTGELRLPGAPRRTRPPR